MWTWIKKFFSKKRIEEILEDVATDIVISNIVSNKESIETFLKEQAAIVSSHICKPKVLKEYGFNSSNKTHKMLTDFLNAYITDLLNTMLDEDKVKKFIEEKIEL
jgi:hypothetical protein